MKIELNENYAYDLSELNDNELIAISCFFDRNKYSTQLEGDSFRWIKNKHKRYNFVKKNDVSGNYLWCFPNSHSKKVINAKTLFEKTTEVIDFKTITDSIASLLEYKNKKYGNSALEPLNVFQGKCKVGQRIDDKLSRVKNNDTLQKNDVADLIGYLFLVCKENEWNNFDEFKD